MAQDNQEFEPKFEGYFVEVGKNEDVEVLKKEILQVLGKDWQFKSVTDSRTEFEVTNEAADLNNAEVWDKCYEVRSKNSSILVEPLFNSPNGEELKDDESAESENSVAAQIMELIKGLFSSCSGATSIRNDLDQEDVLWALRFMKVTDAWDKFFPSGKPGEGIIIGQPDTGYTKHPEIMPNLMLSEAYNFLEENENAMDLLLKPKDELITNPGHGTLAASVAVSPRGAQESFGNLKFVVGVAYGAKLAPLRVTFSVALKSTKNLARAIEYSADKGFHVISISLGVGIPSRRLRRAINYAHKKGVIIVAAAGTWTPYIIYPAAYNEVIAVGGCTIQERMWMGSPRGSNLDITAPSKGVWCARSKKEDDGELEYFLQTGSGTSLATPMVAGVAALWLSYHGRDNLAEKYGLEKIPFLFNDLLKKTSKTPSYWNTEKHGAGIVDAYNLLSEPLPETYEIPSDQIYDESESGFLPDLKLFGNFFDKDGKKEQDSTAVRSLLTEVLQTNEADFESKWAELGQELAFHVASSRNLFEKFEKHFKGGDGNTLMGRMDDSAFQVSETLGTCGLSERFKSKLN